MLTKFNLYQPAAIDNSLNSYQIIHKIIHEMNLIIDEVNNIDSKANEYTDEQINILNTQLRAYINELNDITVTHFNSVDSAILSMNYSIEQLENDISALQISFNNLAVSVTEQINNSINAIKSYVDLQIEIVKKLIEAQNPEVIDCFGHKNKLQSAYNELVSLMFKHDNDITYTRIQQFFANPNHSAFNVPFATLQYAGYFTAVNTMNIRSYDFITDSSPSYLISLYGKSDFENMVKNHYNFIILLWCCKSGDNNLLKNDVQLALDLFGFNSITSKMLSYNNV